MESRKRIRSANFTQEEVRLLLRLASSEKHIIEDKKTDSETWKLKDGTWQKIADKFNSTLGKVIRTKNTLRHKYEGMKKCLKKKVQKNKLEAMKTGGGTSEYVSIDGPERELLEVLCLSVNGLPSISDSDSTLLQTTISGEASTSADTTHHSTFINDNTLVFEVQAAISDEEQELQNDELPDVIIERETMIEEKRDVALESIAANPVSTEEKKKNQTWQNWTPAKIKTRKHPALTPKHRKEPATNKAEKVLQMCQELVVLQMENERSEEARRIEKHQLEITQFREKHQLEMKLLELKIKLKKKELET